MSVINTNLEPRGSIKNLQQEGPKTISAAEEKAAAETAQQNSQSQKVETTDSLKTQKIAPEMNEGALIEAAVARLKEYAENQKRELNFEVHKESGQTVIQVKNGEGEMVRQMPSEEALKLAEMVENKDIGGLLDFLA